MGQFLFLLGLYLSGQLVGLLLGRRIPTLYIAVSGFLWGTVIFAVFLLAWIWLGLPYTSVTLWGYMVCTLLILSIWAWRAGAFRRLIQIDNMQVFGFTLIAFVAAYSYAARNNLTQATADSFTYLMNGKSMAILGLGQKASQWLEAFGVMMPLLQSVTVPLDIGYLNTFQPLLGFTLLATLLALVGTAISQLQSKGAIHWIIAAVVVVGLASINFIIFQMNYLHTNLLEAVFLLNALGCAWLGMVQRGPGWLALSMLGFLGFNLGRVEAPLVTLLFLLPIIASRAFARRDLAITVLPLLGVTSLWLVGVAQRIGEGTAFLTPERILVILAGYSGVALLILISDLEWLSRITKLLPQLQLAGFLGLFAIFLILRPDHMLASLTNLGKNLLISGRWGISWYVVLFLFFLSVSEDRMQHARIFIFGLPSYVLVILDLSYFRTPYHDNWWDSANRMMTHIIPVALFYLAVRFAPRILREVSRITDPQPWEENSSQMYSNDSFWQY